MTKQEPPETHLPHESPDATPGALNPWRSMWKQPRNTVQYLADHNPDRGFWAIAFTTGVYSALNRAAGNEAGDTLGLWAILGIVLTFGWIAGAIGIRMTAAFLVWTGKPLGGNASPTSMKTAVTWANLPTVIGLPILAVQIAIYGSAMFQSGFMEPVGDQIPKGYLLYLSTILVDLVLLVFWIRFLILGIAQTQGFSIGKAIVNALFAGLAFAIALMAVILAFGAALSLYL